MTSGQTLQHGKVAFRVIHDADLPFLRLLYASTREWERRLTLWTDTQWDEFIERQYHYQYETYRARYIGAVHRIIQLDETDIGRLIVNRADDHLRIVVFILLPASRGRGIGTDILRSLLNEAHGGKVPARLMVEPENPALRLYLRHGFGVVGRSRHHLSLEWTPQTGPREL